MENVCCGHFETYSESFLRPLARLRAKTVRPPAVAIRALKPNLRWRLVLLGWYVLLVINPFNPLYYLPSIYFWAPEGNLKNQDKNKAF